MHFVAKGEAAVCFLGGSQSRQKGEDTQAQNGGICEFANRSHEISFSGLKAHGQRKT
jgi:hypothetical protein